jgi:hypothetical protein
MEVLILGDCISVGQPDRDLCTSGLMCFSLGGCF